MMQRVQGALPEDSCCAETVAAWVQSVEGTVRSIARQCGKGFFDDDLEDLRAAGREGALRAARRYDPLDERGASFNTYATPWIRTYVMNQVLFFLSQGRFKATSRTPRTVFFRSARVRRQSLVSAQRLPVSAETRH